MKFGLSKILTVLISISLVLTMISVPSVAAKDEEYLIIDCSSSSKIKASSETLKADTKIVKDGEKYSAKWNIPDARDLVLSIPKDITMYTEISFSVYSVTDCTCYFRINSENSSIDGTDYYGKMLNLKKGWQDISIDIGKDLQVKREPKGYNDVDSIYFSSAGWSQTNDTASMVLYFDNMKLVNNPSYTKLTAGVSGNTQIDADAQKENVGDKIIYNRTYDEAGMEIFAGLTTMPKTNKIEEITENDNTYVKMETLVDEDDCYIEVPFKSESTWFVLEADLCTSTGFEGNFQYKDSNRKDGAVLTISGFDILVNKNPVGKLSKGKWTNVQVVFDILKKTESVYINGKLAAENISYSSAELSGIQLLRLYLMRNQKGSDAMVDNLRIYEGNAIRDLKGQQPESASSDSGSELKPVEGEDVEMELPDIEKIGNGVCLMINESNAYAKKQLTKVDVADANVVPVIKNDRTLVPVRFISESFDADVSWDEAARKVLVSLGGNQIELKVGSNVISINGESKEIDVAAEIINDRTMLPLRAMVEAIGKNVLWDERGLIVITDSSVALDAEKDVKLSTMLIGYLKNGILTTNYAAYPSFTQDIIDSACAATPAFYTASSGNSTPGEKGSKALYYLGLITRFNPQAKATDGTLCKDAALVQLRSLISGGNEPFACVGCYWSHAIVAADLVLVKNTPALYNELTGDEKDRMDWLMRGLAIAGNWGYNDLNNYKTGVDLRGNFGKGYNPNYRNTYLSVVLSASMYFGAEELDKIYTGFSYDEYIKKFEELGFTNILATWTVAGKDLMENGGSCVLVGGVDDRFTAGQDGGSGAGVKIPFKYNGMGPDDIMGIFKNLMAYTYSFKVMNEYGTPGENDYAYIISGKKSPFEGQMGMMRELASSDSGGKRSRCGYSYDSFMILTAVYSNMKLFGGWDSSDSEMRKLDSRAYVGNEDMIFKLAEGYMGHSIRTSSAEYEYAFVNRGYSMDKDIWRNFHCMLNEDVTIAPNPNMVVLDPIESAEPKDAITTPPENAMVSKIYGGGIKEDTFYPLGENYKKATAEFDVVLGQRVKDDEYNCVIIFDKKTDGAQWATVNMSIQFKDGTINVRNFGEYTNSKIRFGANYRFHFKVVFDVDAKKYSVYINQTYPQKEGVTASLEDMQFRLGASEIDVCDAVAVVKNNDDSTMWIENFKITKQ